jgi:primosomal protein N' (replication factor Y) (superfamily II helicase)
MSRQTFFADVILPLSLANLFTYRVPFEMNGQIAAGKRVIVQFGKTKRYAALVRSVHEKPPVSYEAKYIEAVLDEWSIVTETQFKHWEWMCSYYMCNMGEVMVAALPGSLRLASETRVLINEDFTDSSKLTDKEFLVFEALRVSNFLSLEDITQILDQKTVYPIIKAMIEKGAVLVEEELREKFKPKTTDYIRLHPRLNNEDAIRAAFDELSRAPKQLEILMAFIHLTRNGAGEQQQVKKADLLAFAKSTHNTLNALLEKEMLDIYQVETGRLEHYEGRVQGLKTLSTSQQKAHDQIISGFEKQDVCLLHGVTGSGKTEIYVELIARHLEKGEQVLYLLPEIALTAQIISRLRKYFGDQVAVYHSRFNQQERTEVWRHLLQDSGRYKLFVGARSALFLPFEKLGLVIVDEEHETSYKQYNPDPRYHARDGAIVLAKLHGAKTLLGSATPALESYYNVKSGKYFGVDLLDRFGGIQMPEILMADMKKEAKEKTMQSHFSSFLLTEMKEALERNEQIILFQNRRGYSSLWSCQTCQWTPQCTQCDVSLTYHKHLHLLVCHYCGNRYTPPVKCSACGSTKLSMLGFGTEKIEDELPVFLPDVKVARLDFDTTRSKHAHHDIITRFQNHEIDVLVGTQMVTKGLDFDNVSLVGVMSADQMLNFPDFRSFERAYQLLAQVSGRAGRKSKRGKVIVQTWQPYHWILQKVMQNDYEGMALQELAERRQFKYPPYFRVISLVLRHRDRIELDYRTHLFAESLRSVFNERVLGPEYLPVARVRNFYQKQIILKFEKSISIAKCKQTLRQQIDTFYSQKANRPVRISIDVDPL